MRLDIKQDEGEGSGEEWKIFYLFPQCSLFPHCPSNLQLNKLKHGGPANNP